MTFLIYTSVKNVRVQYAGELVVDIGGIEIWFLPSGKSPTSACLIGYIYLLFMPYTRLKPYSCLEESCPMGTLSHASSQCALPLLLTIVVSIPDSIPLIPPQQH